MKASQLASLALTPALFTAMVGSACSSPICTEIGCQSNLTFDFDGEYLPAGDYQVTVETTSGEATCELTVHEDRSSDSDCSGDFEIDPSVRDVVVYDTPETASLQITSDGDEVTSLTATPTYEDYYPNGPDCDDEACQVAFETAELP